MEGSSTSTQEFPMSTRLDFATLTLVDALDLAVLIEVEAYNRYRKFAAQLGSRFAGDAASVFASMAENEAKHGRGLEERRKTMFGDAPVRVSLDDLFDVEAPEEGAPRANMSALRAFEIALASEQKAFDFYNAALPHVTDPEIHALFTELRDEETAHIRMVREAIANLPPGSDAELDLDKDEAPFL
jgi:rubrerythrin